MDQPRLSPAHRLILWIGLLAALNIVDLTLTVLALGGIEGSVELNPFARRAFEHGVLAAALLKAAGVLLVALLALALAHTPHTRTTERVLATWCVLLLAVNAWSAIQLLGVV